MEKSIENIKKAIKHYECVRDDAVVVLDSGFGQKKGENNSVYVRRKLYAELAIESLKKEIPQKVIIPAWSSAKCPNCGEELSESLGDGYYHHMVALKRCPNVECGQRLDWKD